MKKYKKTTPLIFILLFSVLLGGCWDSRELDDLAVPLIGAYDEVLESEKKYPDDKYLITLGIPVFFEDVKEKFHIVQTTGRIMGEARGRRGSKLGEDVILGQLQLLLFGDELLKKESLIELTDIVTRNPTVKASIYIVIVKGRAIDLIKRPVHDYPNVGIYLKALLDNSKKTNFYPYTTLFSFNRQAITYETAAIVPHIIYMDGDIMLAGSCLVNNGKISGEMGREETETAVMLRGIKCRGTLSFEALVDGKVIDEATFEGKNSRKVTVEIVDGKYVFNIKIILSGIIVEHRSQEPIQDGIDRLTVFQDSLEQHIKKRADALVEKTQEEFKFDALCLANYIKAHTREKLTKEDIDKIVQEAEINVEVKVQIRNAGGKM